MASRATALDCVVKGGGRRNVIGARVSERQRLLYSFLDFDVSLRVAECGVVQGGWSIGGFGDGWHTAAQLFLADHLPLSQVTAIR